MLRILHCLDNRLIDGGKVVSLTHPPHFTPQKHYYFNAFTSIQYLTIVGCLNEAKLVVSACSTHGEMRNAYEI
jgi:hypothetical protein